MDLRRNVLAGFWLLVLCCSVLIAEPNLVAHWKLDESSGDMAYDSAGDNDGDIYGATWTSGQIGDALEFDGDDDYVDCGTDASLELNVFTISAWVKPGNVSSIQHIAGKLGNEPTNNRSYGYRLELRYDKASVMIDPSGGGNSNPLESTATLEVGRWYLVTGTYDGSTAQIYLNGELENSGARTLDSYYPKFYIGAHHTDYYNDFRHDFDGVIDDVRLYDGVLSAEEIEELYLEGLSDYEIAVTSIEDAIAEKIEAIENVEAAIAKEIAAREALAEIIKNRDFGDLSKRDVIGAMTKVHQAIQAEKQSLHFLDKSVEDLADSLEELGWDPNLIAHWKLDEPNGTIAYDSVGDNDGDVYGDAVWTDGKIDGALSFDGDDDYIDCGADLINPSQGAIVFWIKTSGAVSPYYEGIIGNRIEASSDFEFQFALNLNYGHVIDIQSPTNLAVRSVTTFDDDKWHHVVGTWGGSTIALYVDGVLEDSDTSAVMPGEVDKNLWIGTYYDYTNRYFNGLIDDVRVYNKALSAEEILQLYEDSKGKNKNK